jgi:hypothetical protein
VNRGGGSQGGGIRNDGGTVNLKNSRVNGNTAGGDGGGSYNALGTVTLNDDSRVNDNTPDNIFPQ